MYLEEIDDGAMSPIANDNQNNQFQNFENDSELSQIFEHDDDSFEKRMNDTEEIDKSNLKNSQQVYPSQQMEQHLLQPQVQKKNQEENWSEQERYSQKQMNKNNIDKSQHQVIQAQDETQKIKYAPKNIQPKQSYEQFLSKLPSIDLSEYKKQRQEYFDIINQKAQAKDYQKPRKFQADYTNEQFYIEQGNINDQPDDESQNNDQIDEKDFLAQQHQLFLSQKEEQLKPEIPLNMKQNSQKQIFGSNNDPEIITSTGFLDIQVPFKESIIDIFVHCRYDNNLLKQKVNFLLKNLFDKANAGCQSSAKLKNLVRKTPDFQEKFNQIKNTKDECLNYLNNVTPDEFEEHYWKDLANQCLEQVKVSQKESKEYYFLLNDCKPNSVQEAKFKQYQEIQQIENFEQITEIIDKKNIEINNISSVLNKIQKQKTHNMILPQFYFQNNVVTYNSVKEQAIKENKILLNEFENIEGNEQRIEQLKAQRDKIASEIKYGIPRENLKQISKDINKIQKELLKIKEYYFIKGINESKLLYPLQILTLDGKINHELNKSEEKILEIYNYLEGLQKQNISQLEKVLKQSENQIKEIQRHLASHLYILDNEQVDKIEEQVQASVRELSFVVKHQEQYQNNLSFVHKCKKTYEGLIAHQKEFQIWKSHCRIHEFLDKEQTANLISNLSIYPLSQSETDKKNHQKYQQKIEIMIRSLKNEIVYLQNFQDIQNGINLQEIIDQMLKFIEPIQKNYIRMLAALDPAKKPQQIDIEIWLNEMKGESLHTLQTKKRLFEFKEQFFQAIQNYIDVNKDQWEIQVEKLTVQQETAKILNFCQDVLIDMEKACLFLDNLMTQGISTYFGDRQQLSKNFDVLEEKFNIQYLNKTLAQYLKYCEEKAKIRQQAREWLQVKKKIITVSYIYDQVKSFSRVMYLIFHSIKKFLSNMIFKIEVVENAKNDIKEIIGILNQLDKNNLKQCINQSGALHTDKQNQSSIEITIKNIYLIGYSTCQQLRDFASLFEKYSQIETFYKEFDGKICISREQGRQIFLLYYKFPSMVKEMIEEYDKQREQKLPPQGEIIQDLIERYIDEFQNQYYKLYVGVNLSSYKQIIEDIEMDNFHDCLSLDNLLTNFKEELNDLEKFDGKNFDQLGFTIEKALEQLQKVIENQDKVDHHIQNPLLTNNKIFNSFKENYQKKDLNMWKIILTNLIQNIKGFKNNFYNYEEGLISYEELMKPFLIYQQNQIQKYDNKEIQLIFEDFKQILDLFCGKIQLNNGSQANLLMSDYIQRNNSRKKTKKQTKTDFKIFQNK